MKRRGPAAWLACAAAATTIALAPAGPVQAQQTYASTRGQAPFAQEQLDQMLAPVALYPDALLAQVLMAATWPLEVVEADRFMRQNPGLSGDALADAVEATPWDPSVRALTQFPSVLAMMGEQLEWTGQLGDAFVAQREQVMDTVQALRARARAAGNLDSTDQQRVVVRNEVIVIEPVYSGLLWVPYYDPRVVFGVWWRPAHRPFFWVPPVVYRPPHFADVYARGFVRGPVVPLRPRLWIDAQPVWRDRYVVIDNRRVNNVIVTRPGAQRPTVWRHDPERARHFDRRPPPAGHIAPRPPAVEAPGHARPRPPAFEAPDHGRPHPPTFESPAHTRPRPPVSEPPDRLRPRPPPADLPDRLHPRPPVSGPADRLGPPRPEPLLRPESRPRRVEKPVSVPHAAPQPRLQPSQRPSLPVPVPTQREPGQRSPHQSGPQQPGSQQRWSGRPDGRIQ